MKIKNLLTKMLFNKRQREVIQKSLIYSAYKYRQHGDVDNAVFVQVVMNEISEQLGVIPQTFSKEDVDRIVARTTENYSKQNRNAYLSGIQEGKKRAFTEANELPEVKTGLVVGTVIDTNKCQNCKYKEDCIIIDAISEIEENKDEETTSNAPQEETSVDETPNDLQENKE